MRGAVLSWASQLAAGTFLLLSIICAVKYRRPHRQGAPAGWKRALAAAGILLGSVGFFSGIVLTFYLFYESVLSGVIAMIATVCMLAVLAIALCRWSDYERQLRELQRTEATPSPKPSLKVVFGVLLVPFLLGSFVFLILPEVPDVQVLKVHWRRTSVEHKSILEGLNEMKPKPTGDPAAALAAYRKEASSIIAGWSRTEYAEAYNNPFSGFPFIEEDSPGNYVIELKDGKPTYFYFDINGRKIELGVIGKGPAN